MATTEFLESSPSIIQSLLQLYELHRNILVQQQEATSQAVMDEQVQGAVAQAAQQAAARAASAGFDAAIQVVREQIGQQMAPTNDALEQLMLVRGGGVR